MYCDSQKQMVDGEKININRMLMADGEYELCQQVCPETSQRGQVGSMRSFWLTTEGRLVCVNQFSEDIKFRYLREINLRSTLSLWITHPELCRETVHASSLAHGTLLELCASATDLSAGRFYNLYARYPLPINQTDRVGARCISKECPFVDEKAIDAKVITTGQELIQQLEPLYVAYFNFLQDNYSSSKLRERVSVLGAHWLVQQDWSELLCSLSLSNVLTRNLIRLAMFLDAY